MPQAGDLEPPSLGVAPPSASNVVHLTYTPQEMENYEKLSRKATEDHMVDAADHIVQVLERNGINYAIMGGFSLRIRGSNRDTFDVDLAVGANMLELRTALAADPR
jgi:hypothetical protein